MPFGEDLGDSENHISRRGAMQINPDQKAELSVFLRVNPRPVLQSSTVTRTVVSDACPVASEGWSGRQQRKAPFSAYG